MYIDCFHASGIKGKGFKTFLADMHKQLIIVERIFSKLSPRTNRFHNEKNKNLLAHTEIMF